MGWMNEIIIHLAYKILHMCAMWMWAGAYIRSWFVVAWFYCQNLYYKTHRTILFIIFTIIIYTNGTNNG